MSTDNNSYLRQRYVDYRRRIELLIETSEPLSPEACAQLTPVSQELEKLFALLVAEGSE